MENLSTENKDKRLTPKVEEKIKVTNEKSIFDLLDMEEAENEKAFLTHIITSKVTGYKFTNDSEDRIIKVQIQNRSINEESGALVDFTFTLNAEAGIIKENDIKDLVGKYIKVIDVIRYVDVNRDFNDKELSRDFRYGGEYANMVVLANSQVEDWEVNTYVDIEVISVANVIKKEKPTGDVKIISIKVEDGSAKTFECKLKHDELNMKLNKEMFKPILGKTIRIRNLTDMRMNGKTYYSTLTMPEQV